MAMSQLLMSKRKITALSNGAFLVGIAVLIYTGAWWPGILLVLWATLAIRQYCSGRKFDLLITSGILLGLTLITWLKITWNILMPVLFLLGGIYVIFREYFFTEDTNGEEKSKEIEEDMSDE